MLLVNGLALGRGLLRVVDAVQLLAKRAEALVHHAQDGTLGDVVSCSGGGGGGRHFEHSHQILIEQLLFFGFLFGGGRGSAAGCGGGESVSLSAVRGLVGACVPGGDMVWYGAMRGQFV